MFCIKISKEQIFFFKLAVFYFCDNFAKRIKREQKERRIERHDTKVIGIFVSRCVSECRQLLLSVRFIRGKTTKICIIKKNNLKVVQFKLQSWGQASGHVWTSFELISSICPKIRCLSIQVREKFEKFLGIRRKSP